MFPPNANPLQSSRLIHTVGPRGSMPDREALLASALVLAGLLSAFLIFASAVPKFIEWEGKDEMMGRLGWSTDRIFKIGFVEVAVALLFLIPRTAFLGAILLAAYLGGAVATHVRVGDPVFMPILIGVVAWVALGLRDRRIFTLAIGHPPHASAHHRLPPAASSPRRS